MFTGRRVDILDSGSLKIQYNRNRYYDYYTGRWLTHDPLDYTDSMNLYEYASSKPVMFGDPWGYGKYDTVTTITEPPNSYATAILASEAVYDTWPRTWINSPWRLTVKARTLLNIALANTIGWTHAAKHLRHFANNTGDELDIGYPDLIKECAVSKAHFVNELFDAVIYVDSTKPFGKSIVTIADYDQTASPMDWFLAVKGYRTWASGEDIKCNDGDIEMAWTIYFRDVYDWELGSFAPGGLVVDHEMASMHRYGEMQEYVMTGSCTVKIKWKCGGPSSGDISSVAYTSCK